MKLKDFNLLATCFMVVAVLILAAPSRSRELTHADKAKYDSGQLPAFIGRCIEICVLVCRYIGYIFIAVEHYFKVDLFIAFSLYLKKPCYQ